MVQIFQRPLDIKDDNLSKQIQNLELGKGPSKNLWEKSCGLFYLRALLKDQKKNIISNSSIELEKPCNITITVMTTTTTIPENFIEKSALSIQVEI